MRRELERDLKPLHVTDEEIEAILEQLGYGKKTMFVFNTRRGSDDKKEQQR